MKTLKKTLCLVLAVVMAVGVLVLPASADYTDKDKIDSDYVAAVNALTQYGILKGKSTTEEVFDPTGNVTRAEVTAMVYRIMTGDTADTYVGNSASYATKAFPKDVFTAWQLGPVGFAANGEIVKGKGNGLFDPNGNVTGYELLVIMLRTLGYGQNHEYEGAKWQVNAITDARALGILTGVKGDMADSLSRQQVAQIVFNAATKCPRVTYVRGNYQYYRDPYDTESTQNVYLVKKATKSETATTTNPWGIPATTTTSTGVTFTYPATDVTKYYSTSTTPAQFDTYGPIRECDLATGLKVDGTHWAITYTNGKANKDTIQFEALDTVHKLGHEGTRIVAYKNPGYKTTAVESKDNPQFIVVFIDTFLGIVTKSWGNTTDPAGHVIKAAGAEVKVYFNTAQYASGNAPAGIDPNSDGSPITLTVDGTFTVGQKIGVNVVTVNQKASTNPVLAAYANAMKKDVPNTSYAATLDGKYPNGPQIDNSAKAAYELTKVSGVVLESITTDTVAGHNNGGVVGFVAGGKQYYYNCTYGNSNPNGTLGAKDLGKTYDLWLDSQGNVLDMALTQPVSGYGVVTNAIVRQVNAKSFYVEATLLLPDGKELTIDVGDSTGNAFVQAVQATTEADRIFDHLVSYTGTLKYYTVTVASPSYTGAKVFESARADALNKAYYGSNNYNFVVGTTDTSLANTGIHVNDNTVFFVAEYTPDNVTPAKNDYNFEDYKIYNGFKAIPELSVELTGQNLVVEAISVDTNGFAKYILVKNAYAQTEPVRTINNINYAYLITKDVFGQVSPKYHTYTAIIEGEQGTLKVALNQAANVDKTGLYSYNQNVNGQGYSQVYRLDGTNNVTPNLNNPYRGRNFMFEKNTYSYKAGVLTHGTTAGAEYYTVDDACKVVLVNTTNGVFNASADLGYLDVYGKTSAIWYQLNEKGYIDLIYIEESEVKPDSGLIEPDKPTDPVTKSYTVTLTKDPALDKEVGLPVPAECKKTATVVDGVQKDAVVFENILFNPANQWGKFAVEVISSNPTMHPTVKFERTADDAGYSNIYYRIIVTDVTCDVEVRVKAIYPSGTSSTPTTISGTVVIPNITSGEYYQVNNGGYLISLEGNNGGNIKIANGGFVKLCKASSGNIENHGTLEVTGNFNGSVDSYGMTYIRGNVIGNSKLYVAGGTTTVYGDYESAFGSSSVNNGAVLSVTGDVGTETAASKIAVNAGSALVVGGDVAKAAKITVTGGHGEETYFEVTGTMNGTATVTGDDTAADETNVRVGYVGKDGSLVLTDNACATVDHDVKGEVKIETSAVWTDCTLTVNGNIDNVASGKEVTNYGNLVVIGKVCSGAKVTNAGYNSITVKGALEKNSDVRFNTIYKAEFSGPVDEKVTFQQANWGFTPASIKDVVVYVTASAHNSALPSGKPGIVVTFANTSEAIDYVITNAAGKVVATVQNHQVTCANGVTTFNLSTPAATYPAGYYTIKITLPSGASLFSGSFTIG